MLVVSSGQPPGTCEIMDQTFAPPGMPAIRRKRVFTLDDKLSMLEAASQSSVSAVATQHGLKPSQLFHWRKQLRTHSLSPTARSDELIGTSYFEQMMTALDGFREDLGTLVAERIKTDLKANRISAHNAATAFSCLTTSACKLIEMRIKLMESIQSIPIVSADPANSNLVYSEQVPEIERRDVSRFAEKLLAEMHRTKTI